MPTGNQKRRSSARLTKDRVLQARIPGHLDEELREQAGLLGLSVSTVVRNVLLNTFQLVEGVVADSTRVARVIQGRRSPVQAEPGASVTVGWQEAILNLNGICEQCNRVLHKGTRAAVGVPVQTRPTLLCPDCLDTLAAATNSTGGGNPA